MSMTLQLYLMRLPSSLPKALPIMPMPPLGWKMGVWDSKFWPRPIAFHIPDDRMFDSESGSPNTGTELMPPPSATRGPRVREDISPFTYFMSLSSAPQRRNA